MPCWAELRSADPPVAAEFYRELFGWAYEPDAGWFRRGGLAVAGLVRPGDGPRGWLTYLATDEVAGLTDLAVDAGGALLLAPVEIPGRGRAALLADPAGAVFGAWQRGRFAGAQVGSEPGTVCWSELVTPDVPGSTAFYSKVFGWTAQPGELAPGLEYQEWIVGEQIVGGMYEVPVGVHAQWRSTIEVADLAAVRRRCLDLAGRVLLEPIDVAVGRYARLADPEGAGFGVVELVPELRDLGR
jgi:predicted enzyme related to lactoylglutathione lyase